MYIYANKQLYLKIDFCIINTVGVLGYTHLCRPYEIGDVNGKIMTVGLAALADY